RPNVRVWHRADVPCIELHFRFWGQTSHGGKTRAPPILTRSRPPTARLGFSSDRRSCSLPLWSAFRCSVHEVNHLLEADGSIFVGIHRLEDSFVSRLPFL